MIIALSVLSGCDGSNDALNGAASGRGAGSNQADAQLRNAAPQAMEPIENICADCPPPNYTGPPLG
jgi:hypothetical protein